MLGGAALSHWLQGLDDEVEVVIGNDELISWQDNGDAEFNIHRRLLCDEKLMIHRANPQEMTFLDVQETLGIRYPYTRNINKNK